MSGKKVLEIGCAKGFVVEDLREFGADCYGLDISSYAISKSTDIVKPFLTIADGRTHLSKYADNEFDVVFSLRFLECIDEKELPALISVMNRISKFQ
ncbi:MAG: class I SAM-dependent methyltransferase, partial [Patescibacteria group bacterium]|nr:class I SAM-dependent methyltransferase [Patescibacteria group bacterium]